MAERTYNHIIIFFYKIHYRSYQSHIFIALSVTPDKYVHKHVNNVCNICANRKTVHIRLDDSPVMVTLPFRFHSVISQCSQRLRALRGILTAEDASGHPAAVRHYVLKQYDKRQGITASVAAAAAAALLRL